MMHNTNRIHLRRQKYEIITSRLITILLHVLGQLLIFMATGLSIRRDYRNCGWLALGKYQAQQSRLDYSKKALNTHPKAVEKNNT
jgi:hypothetical protein